MYLLNNQDARSGYPTTLLNDKLRLIEQDLTEKGIQPLDILFVKAYLLCLGKSGLLKETGGYDRRYELFDKYLSKAPELKEVLDKAFDSSEVKAYLQDQGGRLAASDESFFKDTFQEQINLTARSRHWPFDGMQASELTELAVSLSGYRPGMTVYNPYAGVASYAGAFQAGNSFHAEEYDPKIWATGVLKMLLENCFSENYLPGNSICPTWNRSFDIVISTPPFGRVPGDSKKTFGEDLFKKAQTLLKENGRMVLVAQNGMILPPIAQRLLATNMLSTVIALPRHLFYWSSLPCVVLILERRSENDPITLMEGSSFFTAGGRSLNVLKVRELLDALSRKNPEYVVDISRDELKKNQYCLQPCFYLDKTADAGKEPVVRLKDLGSFLNLSRVKDPPETGIRIKDLSKGPDIQKIRPKPLTGKTGAFRKLDRQALLIFATNQGIKTGLVSADPEHPVFLAPAIEAFVPDPEKADVQYIALALSQADLSSFSRTSVFIIPKAELALCPVPFLSLEDQKKKLRSLGIIPCEKVYYQCIPSLFDEIILNTPAHTEFSESISVEDHPGKFWEKNPFLTTPKAARRPVVVWIGPELEGSIMKRLRIKKHFDKNIGQTTIAWLMDHKKTIDAIVVHHSGDITTSQITPICSLFDNPLFIISNNLAEIEKDLLAFDENIVERCFHPEYEEELLTALEKAVSEANSPEGRIRRKYAKQLEAIKDIDARFSFQLESIFMEILLDMEEGRTVNFNKLRSIRDENCLNILADFGYIPARRASFDYGAQAIFLADRHFYIKDEDIMYVLLKRPISRPLGVMLKAVGILLSDESHTSADLIDKDIQEAVVLVMLALFTELSRMNNEGCFDDKRKKQVHWQERTKNVFVSGVREVQLLDTHQNRNHKKDYYYADEIHLDKNICDRNGIKEGDKVDIQSVSGWEKKPIVDDMIHIIYYSKNFKKSF